MALGVRALARLAPRKERVVGSGELSTWEGSNLLLDGDALDSDALDAGLSLLSVSDPLSVSSASLVGVTNAGCWGAFSVVVSTVNIPLIPA